MVICNFEYCHFNKEHFCTRENTIIKNANGFPACEIFVNRDGTIGSNYFADRKKRDVIIEEGYYEQFTEDTTGDQDSDQKNRSGEDWDYNEIADAAKYEAMFDT